MHEMSRYEVEHQGDWVALGKNANGFDRTNYLHSKEKILKALAKTSIQVVNEGHRITVIVPTDKYYVFDTTKLNELRMKQLEMVADLVRCFPKSKIHIAGFTDDVGDKEHKRVLSQHRAQAMLAFLWSRGIRHSDHLDAEGYEDKYNIGNNRLIHGSAYNRRIEIQWMTS